MKSVNHHSRLTKTLAKSLAFFLVFLVSFSAFSQDIDEARQKEGKKLFKSLCASCHKLDKKLVGPALAGIEERRTNEWLKAWIKDNAALLGDCLSISSVKMTSRSLLAESVFSDIFDFLIS